MTNLIETDKAILPIESIMVALNITKEKLLSYDVKPEIINGKPYYSLDNLDKIRQTLLNS